MIARTTTASSGRSTPAMPRQIAAGVMSRSPMTSSMTSWSTFSTSSSPTACRFAPPPRASASASPRSFASWQTVFVPPASIPSTWINRESLIPRGPGADGCTEEQPIPCVSAAQMPAFALTVRRAHCYSQSLYMQSDGARVRLRRAAMALAVCCLVWAVARERPVMSAEAPAEVRALWVLRTSLTTPAAIAALVRTARQRGFNTLLVQVRGRGDAYYDSALEPRATDLIRQPSNFDPLATVIREAHDGGLRVHAWINL